MKVSAVADSAVIQPAEDKNLTDTESVLNTAATAVDGIQFNRRCPFRAQDLSSYLRPDGTLGMSDHLRDDLAVWAALSPSTPLTVVFRQPAAVTVHFEDPASGTILLGCTRDTRLAWIILNSMFDYADKNFANKGTAEIHIAGALTDIKHPTYKEMRFEELCKEMAKRLGFAEAHLKFDAMPLASSEELIVSFTHDEGKRAAA